MSFGYRDVTIERMLFSWVFLGSTTSCVINKMITSPHGKASCICIMLKYKLLRKATENHRIPRHHDKPWEICLRPEYLFYILQTREQQCSYAESWWGEHCEKSLNYLLTCLASNYYCAIYIGHTQRLGFHPVNFWLFKVQPDDSIIPSKL